MTYRSEKAPNPASAPGQRGPAEHERREQILKAADEHFRRYGYNRTTVADLAKSIGLSTAYIYKFFGSKQAIGEAICSQYLGDITRELRAIVDESRSTADRLRRIFQRLADLGREMFFHERELHDMAVTACKEKWPAVHAYQADLLTIVRDLVAQGREAGEFERKTPIEETSRAILQTMEPFSLPVYLEFRFDDLDERVPLVANLVLRSLAP